MANRGAGAFTAFARASGLQPAPRNAGVVGLRAGLVFHGPRHQSFAVVNQSKVDLSPVEIDAADLYPDPRADGVANARALAAQFLARLVETEVFAAEFGDVDQPFDVHRVERDKDAKAGRRRDDAAELFAQMLAHVLAFKPGLDVAAGFVGTPFVGTAVQPGRLPGELVGAGFFRLLLRVFDTGGQPFGQLCFGFTRRWQGRQLVLAFI